VGAVTNSNAWKCPEEPEHDFQNVEPLHLFGRAVWIVTTIKIVRLSVTVGDRGKRRAARGWLSDSQQQTLSGRAARVCTPIGASLLCLCGHGLHCFRTPKSGPLPLPSLAPPMSVEPKWISYQDVSPRPVNRSRPLLADSAASAAAAAVRRWQLRQLDWQRGVSGTSVGSSHTADFWPRRRDEVERTTCYDTARRHPKCRHCITRTSPSLKVGRSITARHSWQGNPWN